MGELAGFSDKLSSEQNVQECDTTDDDSSTVDGKKIIENIQLYIVNCQLFYTAGKMIFLVLSFITDIASSLLLNILLMLTILSASLSYRLVISHTNMCR
jgi:hypothetical protein